jgi:transposase
MHQGILLTVDYHDQNCVIRRRDLGRATEDVVTVPTTPGDLLAVLADARRRAGRRGPVVWVQESTTGWARVGGLLGTKAEFVLANVLQMPRPPKGQRRKTDRVDTARLEREYLNGQLPRAHQPPAWWREVRRVVGLREDLVSRRTALRNWVNRYLAHETWADRVGLWSARGGRRLRALAATLPARDGFVVTTKLDELDRLGPALAAVEAELHAAYRECPDARRLDAVRGIGVVSAVSIVARIGPVERFATAEQLIAFAGLAPGVHQSDQTRRDGRIGGGGTDGHLRHYLIEASVWARQLPRYRAAYERVAKRRGPKVGRVVVARLLLRGIYKVLRDGAAFAPGAAAAGPR